MKVASKLIFSCLFLYLTVQSEVTRGQSLSDTLQINQVDVFGKRIIAQQNTAATVTEIDTLVMKSMGVMSMSELLSGHSPIFIKSYGRGSMASASFRGTAPSHTAVNWNGIQLNSPMLGMVDFSLLPVGFFDEITLKHGSSSLDQSGGALGGSIEMKNTTNWNNRVSGLITSSIASFSTYDDWFRINIGTSRVQSQTRAFYSSSKNDFKYRNPLIADIDPQTGQYIFPIQKNENADWLNYGILQELYFRISDNQFITTKTWWQNTNRSIPTLATNERLNSASINRQNDKTWRGVIEWDWYGPRASMKFNSGFNTTKLEYLLQNKIYGTDGLQDAIRSNSQTQSWFNTLDVQYRCCERLKLEIKNESNFHQVETVEQVKQTGYDANRFDNSFILKALYHIKNLHFSGLLRQSFTDHQWLPIIPMLGIEYSGFDQQNIKLFARAARNYHMPTLNDLYYQPGGNPDLRPEAGKSFDIGGSISSKWNRQEFNLSINGFYSTVNNWIVWLPTHYGGWEPMNVKKVRSSGIEASSSITGVAHQIQYKWLGTFALSNSINYGDPAHWSDKSIGKQLPYIPKYSANSLLFIAYQRYEFNYSWSYYSKRYTTTSNETTSPLDYLYAYFMNDITFRTHFKMKKSRLTGELKVFNLLNESYRTVLQRMMPGRNYSLTINYSF